jgi:hypothetical protein
MAEYLYHAYVYHNTANVIGANNSQEATNTTDFETNYKSIATEVEDVKPGATMFDIVKSYTDFKALIVNPITWADVKYANEDGKVYDLYLLTGEPL